jgi:hypothetical protein
MSAAPSLNVASRLEGWLPARVAWHQGEPFFDWFHVGDKRFTEPFFDHTIEACLRYPFNLLFRPLTPLRVLRERYELSPGLAPSGFIFHLSRCGSTLISQMLAALPQNVVISEASPIDWMIRARVRRPQTTDEERVEWLRWVVGALGQKRNPEAEHLFIKFDAWHIRNLPLLERAFPATPWLFLYRDPLEVMVSHYLQPGSQMVPGMIDLQWDDIPLPAALTMPRVEYCARVLAEICREALGHTRNPNGRLVNYTQLPDFVTGPLLPHFRLGYDDEQKAQIRAAARFNAKTPTAIFRPDAEEKRRQATDAIRRRCDELLTPLYEQLETARHNQDLRC